MLNLPSSEQNLLMMRFANLCAFERQLAVNTAYRKYFGQDEAMVTQLMLAFARQNLKMPSLKLQMLEPILHQLPYALQSSYFNSYQTGYDEHVTVRKVMIKEAIDNAIQNGTQRILFIRPGLCNRAYLTSMQPKEFREVEYVEIDLEPIIDFKTQFYQTQLQGVVHQINDKTIINQKLVLLKACLNQQTVKDVLDSNHMNLNLKTLVIIEALTPYLSVELTHQLLNPDNLGLTEDSEVLVGFMEKQSVGQQSFGLKADDATLIPYEQLSNDLNRMGWEVSTSFSDFTGQRLLSPSLREEHINMSTSLELYVTMHRRPCLTTQNLMDVDEMQLPSFAQNSPLAIQLAQHYSPNTMMDTVQYVVRWPLRLKETKTMEPDDDVASVPGQSLSPPGHLPGF